MSAFDTQEEGTDFQSILDSAGELAKGFQHRVVDHAHFFVAILTTDCLASKYCKSIDAEKWRKWLEMEYPAEGYYSPEKFWISESAQNVINHCSDILKAINDEPFHNSIHLLLALLCMDTNITEDFSTQGIIFENLAEEYFGKPVQRTSPDFNIRSYSRYNWLEKLFMSKARVEKKHGELYYLALDLVLYRRYNEAILICKKGLSIFSDDLSLNYLHMVAHLRSRDFKSTIPLLLACKNDFPEIEDLDKTLANIYSEIGNYEEADKWYSFLQQTFPNDPWVYNGIGFRYYLQKRYAEAIPYYEKAIELGPELAYPYDNLGFVLHKTGETEKGTALINKALEMDKGNSFAYKYKGIVYLEQGNKEEARKNFDLALKFHYTIKYGNEVNELIAKLENSPVNKIV